MTKGNSIHQLWDKLFKIISDRFPEEIVRFVFPDKHIELCGKYEQEKVLLDYQVADVNRHDRFGVEPTGHGQRGGFKNVRR